MIFNATNVLLLIGFPVWFALWVFGGVYHGIRLDGKGWFFITLCSIPLTIVLCLALWGPPDGCSYGGKAGDWKGDPTQEIWLCPTNTIGWWNH